MFVSSSPKYFSQLRNIFLPSLYSPSKYFCQQEDEGTQADVSFPSEEFSFFDMSSNFLK